MMKKEYIKPASDIYAISLSSGIMDLVVSGETDTMDSKGGSWDDSDSSWEDDDDLDGGSAIW